jgi:hypothetical protein
MTKTCDFLQIMIQFDQKGQPFTVRDNTLSFSMAFFNNK